MPMTGSAPPGARLTIGSIAPAQVDVTGPSTATTLVSAAKAFALRAHLLGARQRRGGACLVAHLHADGQLSGAPAPLREDHLDRLGVLDAVVAHRAPAAGRCWR